MSFIVVLTLRILIYRLNLDLGKNITINNVLSSLQRKTPWEKYKELENFIPCLSEVQKNYIPSKEPFATQNHKHDQMLQ
ncbi:hypothetical protein DK880_00064 [Candidatus Cardinium hertigii]|uniref:Uncharacterized protein n=1 Tax=Candidatus Cardinium hertigii TaxID=247481 RepID=A0A2Z3LAV7_9BACT|nr:hypothetical protein DK880_00064 [Candidatus Cardinium hertigii]